MLYQISRNGQMYGPYTLEDMRRYVASGNVLPTDLAKNEEMADWLPVSEILGDMPAAAAPPAWGAPAPGYAAAEPAIHPNQFPDPPKLHWGLVLLFTVLTCGLFWYVWVFVQNVWLKKVQPASNALFYWIGLVVFAIVRSIISIPLTLHPTFTKHSGAFFVYVEHPILGLLSLVSIALYCLAAFATRTALEEHFNGPEPIGLRLSGVMTFFFSVFYFQYHLTRLAEIKQMARYQEAR